jgi:hypothetical protein
VPFIEFQYGTLNELNRAHNSVIQILRKYAIWDESEKNIVKGLASPLQGCKDKDKDIYKDKDILKGECEGGKTAEIPFSVFWDLYDKKRGDKIKLEKKWKDLGKKDREAIIEYIPKYKESQPNKIYRKDPATFLANKSWNDELIPAAGKVQGPSGGEDIFDRQRRELKEVRLRREKREAADKSKITANGN